jgi:TP901 family phage tail tape measure protein
MARNKDTRVIEIVANGTKASDSIKQLSAAARKLRSDLRQLDPASKEFADGTKRMGEVNKRLHTLTGSLRNSASAWSRFKREAKTVFTGVLAANVFQGVQSAISNFFNSATDGAYKLSDALADVRKTTGMMQNEVELLYADLGSIDTRTSRMELLQLARDAGKLGIEGRENIVQFVDAADKINVALGEDLGADAIKNIAKLNTLLGASEKYGYGEAMLKTGSALNYLGAKSVAAEGFMVQLAKRLGGVADLADMSIPQVLGIASALDNLGQASEMSATAVQKTLVAIATKSEEAAKIAGVPLQEFKRMVDEDINSAFIAFLKGVNGSGGLAAIKGNLDLMGLSSERVTQVIGSLASQTELLTAEQEKANTAFEENTSILDEFEIKNTTTAARAEKAWKKLYGQFKPLQQQIGSFSADALEWLSRNIGAIITLVKWLTLGTAAWASYNIAVKLSNISIKQNTALQALNATATKFAAVAKALLTGNIKKARIAMQAFNVVTKANPIGLLVATITVATGAFLLFNKQLDKMGQLQKELNDIELKANQSIVQQKLEVEQLLRVAKDENRSKEERIKAVNNLNKIVPEYNEALTLEKVNTEKAKTATDDYINSLLKKARVQAAESRLVEIEKQKIDLLAESLFESASMWDKLVEYWSGGFVSGESDYVEDILQKRQDEIDILDKKKDLLIEIIDKGEKERKLQTDEDSEDGTGTTKLTEEEKQKLIQNTRKINDQLARLHIESIREEERRELALLEFKYQKRREEIESTVASEKVKNSLLRAEELDYLRKKHEMTLDYAEKRDKEEFDLSLKNLQNHQRRELLQESMRHANGETSAEEYEANMTAIKTRHLEERKVLYSDYGKDTTEIEQQITDAVIANNQARMQSDQAAFDQAYNLERARLEMKLQVFEEGSDAWLKANQELLDLEAEQMRQHLERLGLAREDIDKYFANAKKARNREIREDDFEIGVRIAEESAAKMFQLHEISLNKRTEKEENARNADLKDLENKLKLGLLSEEEYMEKKDQINAQYDQKERSRKREAWQAQKAADMATAIIQGILAVIKATPNVPLMAFAKVATAVNLASIASTPTPQFEQGTVLRGPSHAGGGIDIYGKNGTFYGNAEGDEIILNKKVYRSPVGRKMASDLNQAFGGIRFDGFSSTAPPQFSLGGVTQNSSNSMATDLKSFEKNVIKYLAAIHSELGKPSEAFFTFDTWKNAQDDVKELEDGGRLN